ncbi:hypothetical protein QYF36_018405 [Acer negundo]|nr:hypothetical protein QYF36_018405 [Acer negundo]
MKKKNYYAPKSRNRRQSSAAGAASLSQRASTSSLGLSTKRMNRVAPNFILGSKIAARNLFIYKLQMENKLIEKECNEAHQQLLKKEEEVAALQAKLEMFEGKGSTFSSVFGAASLSQHASTSSLGLSTRRMNRDAPKFILGSKIVARNLFIYKLQMENMLIEKECNEAHQQLLKKEEEIDALRAKLEMFEGNESTFVSE